MEPMEPPLDPPLCSPRAAYPIMGEMTSYFQSIMALSACMVHLLYKCVVPVHNFDLIRGTALTKLFKLFNKHRWRLQMYSS